MYLLSADGTGDLYQVANNSRFLMLIRRPNLASRILGANLRQLSSDWEARYGHPRRPSETATDQGLDRAALICALGALHLNV